MMTISTTNTQIQDKSIETIDFSLNSQAKIKIYKIKISDLRPISQTQKNQRPIYLSLTFNTQKNQLFQTKCIDILNDSAHFQIKTVSEILRIEIIDYDTLKRLSKFNLKGINKQFNYKHNEIKSNLLIIIQRTDVKLASKPVNVKCCQSRILNSANQQSKQSVITNSTEASMF